MSVYKSTHLVQITATRVKQGEELSAGYLNTCKHRDASVAECDVWEFDATPLAMLVDEPSGLFGEIDCAVWGKEADRLLTLGDPHRDRPVLGMAALYSMWCEPTSGDEDCDMGGEFLGWVEWAQVVNFAVTIARP